MPVDPGRPLLAAAVGAATGIATGAVVTALSGLALVRLIRAAASGPP
jgi:hypothetical protein